MLPLALRPVSEEEEKLSGIKYHVSITKYRVPFFLETASQGVPQTWPLLLKPHNVILNLDLDELNLVLDDLDLVVGELDLVPNERF